MRLEEAFGRFLDSLRAAKRSPHTVDAYRRDLAMVAELLVDPVDKTVTDMELEDIDLAALRHAFAIRAELSSPATMARTHPVWSRLYRFLRSEGRVTINPVEEIDRATVGTARPRSIRHTDLARWLLGATEERLTAPPGPKTPTLLANTTASEDGATQDMPPTRSITASW